MRIGNTACSHVVDTTQDITLQLANIVLLAISLGNHNIRRSISITYEAAHENEPRLAASASHGR